MDRQYKSGWVRGVGYCSMIEERVKEDVQIVTNKIQKATEQ